MKFSWFTFIILLTLTKITFAARIKKFGKITTLKVASVQVETENITSDIYISAETYPTRAPEVIKDFEQAYIDHFVNATDPEKAGLWPEAKKIERLNKLAAMCTRAHFLHGGDMYEIIEKAKVKDGILHFVKKQDKYKPLRIHLVKYKSDVEDKHYYITKGLQKTCVFYLTPLNTTNANGTKTGDYYISEYLREVPMPTL